MCSINLDDLNFEKSSNGLWVLKTKNSKLPCGYQLSLETLRILKEQNNRISQLEKILNVDSINDEHVPVENVYEDYQPPKPKSPFLDTSTSDNNDNSSVDNKICKLDENTLAQLNEIERQKLLYQNAKDKVEEIEEDNVSDISDNSDLESIHTERCIEYLKKHENDPELKSSNDGNVRIGSYSIEKEHCSGCIKKKYHNYKDMKKSKKEIERITKRKQKKEAKEKLKNDIDEEIKLLSRRTELILQGKKDEIQSNKVDDKRRMELRKQLQEGTLKQGQLSVNLYI